MRLSLVSLLLPALVAAAVDYDVTPEYRIGDCSPTHDPDTPFEDDTCASPFAGVVGIAGGSYYLTAIVCNDCGHTEYNNTVPISVKRDYELLFNVTLSPNNRTLLLNSAPIFPKLETIPNPPAIYTPQLQLGFTFADLSMTPACPDLSCTGEMSESCKAWCKSISLGVTPLDYSYTARSIKYDGNKTVAEARYWEIVLDPLGGYGGYEFLPQWKFDDPDRESLRIVVAGTPVGSGQAKGKKKPQPSSDLFAPADDDDGTVYEYQIVEIKTMKHQLGLPSKKLTLWAKVRRFFGMDVWKEDGHLVYLREEWGTYGKHGTLRSMFGEFIHWDEWGIIGQWSGIALGSLFGLWFVYKLITLLMLQRELARWDGMDAVWARIRVERPDDEEDGLLDDGYYDEPDEDAHAGPSHRYTDEPRLKPLPSKPLPEKPLPAVPLIDA